MTVKKKTHAKKTARRPRPAAKAPAHKVTRSARRRPSAKAAPKRRPSKRTAPAGKLDIRSLVINAAVGIAGAVGVSLILSHIPAKKDGTPMIPAGIAPFAPIVSGAALAILLGKKNKLAASAGLGAMIAGGLSLAKAHLPKLGLGYDDDFQGEGYQLPPQLEEGAMLGWTPTTQGLDISGNVSLAADVNLSDDSDDMDGDDEEFMGYDDDTSDLL